MLCTLFCPYSHLLADFPPPPSLPHPPAMARYSITGPDYVFQLNGTNNKPCLYASFLLNFTIYFTEKVSELVTHLTITGRIITTFKVLNFHQRLVMLFIVWQCSHQNLLAKGHKYMATPLILSIVIVLLHLYHCKSAWWHHFLLRREEEECVTAKNLKQAESPTCTKNRTHLPTSSQFHDLRPHNAVLPS